MHHLLQRADAHTQNPVEADALGRVAEASRGLASLHRAYPRRPIRRTQVEGPLRALCSAIEHAEALGIPADRIRSRTEPARAVHARSPFIRRLQTWPRGYAGDYETIEYLLEARVKARGGTVEYWLEYLGLHSPIASQHRHKVHAQSDLIRAVLMDPEIERPRILVIACGGSAGLAAVAPLARARGAQVVLNDVDPAALAFSRERLVALEGRLETVPGNVFKVLRRLARSGRFDVVATGGLFDYLPERAAQVLLRSCRRHLLAPRGRLFYTNIAIGNPQRVWMEYMTEWSLIERSEVQMRALARDTFGSDVHLRLAKEPTGLAWLASVRAPERTG